MYDKTQAQTALALYRILKDHGKFKAYQHQQCVSLFNETQSYSDMY